MVIDMSKTHAMEEGVDTTAPMMVYEVGIAQMRASAFVVLKNQPATLIRLNSICLSNLVSRPTRLNAPQAYQNI